ncbi:hypothetical protein D3C78_1509300 [compost metagenome]
MHIASLKDLPVGGIVLPFPIGIGCEKVPVIYPVTHVQSPEPNFIGCSVIFVSGANTNIGFKAVIWVAMSLV